jgi:hypothetical protein
MSKAAHGDGPERLAEAMADFVARSHGERLFFDYTIKA